MSNNDIANVAAAAVLPIIIFYEHHDDHTHQRVTEVQRDVSDLTEKGISWHYVVVGEDDIGYNLKMWSETAEGETLAMAEVNTGTVNFLTTFDVLVDATLSALSFAAERARGV